MTAPAGAVPSAPLPYGRIALRILDPLHRALVPLNRLMAPALKAGLGPFISNPATGYLMVLRTRGRTTGRIREVPVGYVIVDGAIYCCPGFGGSTAWYQNLLADPAVEVVLPGRTLSGRAFPVTDPEEWLRAYRVLMASLGLVSRVAMGDLAEIDDETLRRTHRGMPLVRITPTAVTAGQLDPGGRFWLVSLGTWLLLLATLVATVRRVTRAGRIWNRRHR